MMASKHYAHTRNERGPPPPVRAPVPQLLRDQLRSFIARTPLDGRGTIVLCAVRLAGRARQSWGLLLGRPLIWLAGSHAGRTWSLLSLPREHVPGSFHGRWKDAQCFVGRRRIVIPGAARNQRVLTGASEPSPPASSQHSTSKYAALLLQTLLCQPHNTPQYSALDAWALGLYPIHPHPGHPCVCVVCVCHFPTLRLRNNFLPFRPGGAALPNFSPQPFSATPVH